MSSLNRKRLVYAAVVLIVVVIAAVVFVMPQLNRGTYVPYAQFQQELQAGEVQSAELSQGQVTFSLADSQDSYYTEDPGYDGFKRDLLVAGVNVTEENDAASLFFTLFDLLVDVFFVLVVVFAVYKLAGFMRNTFKVARRTNVRFSDVAGLDDVKSELSQAVAVLKDPGAYVAKGIRPVRGIVLEGPPGNGKTLLAKALAGEADVRFIAAKGADFQGAFMSMGAWKIKTLFSKARKNAPCIVFIDEFDSIGERRNYAGTGIDKENNRIITTMLNEMDGFSQTQGVLVIAATNSYASLDAALVRPGRFDVVHHIDNPDAQVRQQLVSMYTKGKQLADGLSPDVLALAFEGMSCAAIESVLNEAALLANASGGTITDNILAEAHRRVRA